MIKTSETVAEISAALADFRRDVKQPTKDANNPFFKSKYVTLDGTTKAIDDVAPKLGLSYVQNALNSEDGNLVGVQTRINHKSGEFLEFDPLYLKPVKQDPQAYGSALTYARRYSLSAAFGIASDVDDDGNEATHSNQNKSGSSDYKSNSGNNANVATEKQIGMIKSLLRSYTNSSGIDGREVMDWALNTVSATDLNKLTKKQASDLISTLNTSIDNLKNKES